MQVTKYFYATEHICYSAYAIARPSVCLSDGGIIEQESCAIAKMTVRCALYK